jgi:transcriptional regulator with XRE-family HTH domain
MSSPAVETASEVIDDRAMLLRMRKLLGLRQPQIAQATGIDVAQISRFENGHGELSREQVRRLADYLAAVTLERSEAATLPTTDDVSLSSQERGRALRDCRRTWGIKQYELAAEATMYMNLISMYEQGYIEFDEEEVKRVTDALNSLIAQKRAQLEESRVGFDMLKRRLKRQPRRLKQQGSTAPLRMAASELFHNAEEARVLQAHILDGVEHKVEELKEFLLGRMAPGTERDELAKIVSEIEEAINE